MQIFEDGWHWLFICHNDNNIIIRVIGHKRPPSCHHLHYLALNLHAGVVELSCTQCHTKNVMSCMTVVSRSRSCLILILDNNLDNY